MLPDSLIKTTDQYFEEYRQDVISTSNGKLFDFSVSSLITLLGEVQALAIARLIEAEVDLVDVITSRVVENLGFVRQEGQAAVGLIRYQLTNTFDRDFIIPRGHRTLVGTSTIFETINDLIIPAGIDSKNPFMYDYCRVDASATTIGSNGNQPSGQIGILQQVLEIDSAWLDFGSSLGKDEETTDDFFDRVSAIISKFLEKQESLIASSDFENVVQDLIGDNAIAVAIADITRDGAATQLASMNLYVCNKDASLLTTAEKNLLIKNIEPKSPLVQGRFYVSDLIVRSIDIYVSIGVPVGKDFTQIANLINDNLRSRFSVINTLALKSLELYEAVYQVKLTNAVSPIITWAYTGDNLAARNLPLPTVANASSKTAPVRINLIKVINEPIGNETNFYE